MEVQMARRVAVLKHRIQRADPHDKLGFHFRRSSKFLHRQPVPEPSEEEAAMAGCCSICSRSSGPDIFEVVSQEETMVPCMPIFQDWLRGKVSNMMVLDLLAEEFGWNCCRCFSKPNNLKWQIARRDYFRGTRKDFINYGEVMSEPIGSTSLFTDDETQIPRTDEYCQGKIFQTGNRWDSLY